MKQTFFLLTFSVLLAYGQDVPPPPDSAHKPTLDNATNFIAKQWNDQGPVRYTQTWTNNGVTSEPTKGFQTVSEVTTEACTIQGSRMAQGQNFASTFSFSFTDVDEVSVASGSETISKKQAENGHPEDTVEFAPAIYTLTVTAQAGKKLHLLKPTVETKLFIFYFRDETMARRMANAMTFAVDACGGGRKDAF